MKRNGIFAALQIACLLLIPPVSLGQTPSPQREIPSGDTISLQTPSGAVQVSNFYKTAAAIYESYIQIESTSDYDIVFNGHPEEFDLVIGLTSKPIASALAKAEAALLRILKIEREDACKLNVRVGVPDWLDPILAGGDFGLSFCSIRTPFPISPTPAMPAPKRNARAASSLSTKRNGSSAASPENVLASFLSTHPKYRVMNWADPPNMLDDEEYLNQFNPTATGDANGDGLRDLAVIIVREDGEKKLFSLVCFNGLRRGYATNPFWIIKDSDAPLFNTKILANRTPELVAWFCFHCDDASVYVWNGRSYQQKNREDIGASAVQEELVEQMIRDGEIKQECVTAAGGATKAVDITPIDYNRDGLPEFYVSGGYCGTGARRAFNWIYRSTNDGYTLIFSLVGDVKMLRARTNGYPDILTQEFSGPDTYYETLYQFSGRRYQAVKCKDCVYRGSKRKPMNLCKPIKCG